MDFPLTRENIILAMLVTLAVYCIFPLLYGIFRKSPTLLHNFKATCWAVNGVPLVVMLIVFSGLATFPYLFWTGIFSTIGGIIFRKRGLAHLPERPAEAEAAAPSDTEEQA